MRIGHIAQHISQHLLGGFAVARVAGHLERFAIRQRHDRLIVEHLLEMGQQPLPVGGIAVETVTDMIVDPSAAHLPQGMLHHLQHVMIPGALVITQ